MLTVQSSSGLYLAVQYDGTNGAEIADALGASDLAISPSGALLFTAFWLRAGQPTSGHRFRAQVNYWVVWADLVNQYVVGVVSPAEFADQYQVVCDCSVLADKVNRSGDTMTGALTVNATLSAIYQGVSGDIMRLMSTALSSNVTSGGELTPNADPTKIDISALTGWIIDYNSSAPTSPTNPMITYLNIPAQIGITPSFSPATWFLINSAGALVQQSTRPTPTQRRQNLTVGSVLVQGGVIIADQTIPVIPSQPVNQLIDLMDGLTAFGTSGNVLSANGVNLSFNKTVGGIFFRGFNQIPDHLDPHNSVLPAQTPVQFRRITAVPGGASGVVTTLDVANYDPNGAGIISPIGGGANTSTNFRVWASPNNTTPDQILVQYGQNTYASLTAARDAIGAGTYVPNPVVAPAALLGWITATRTATNLSDPAQAVFTRAAKFASP